MCYVQKYSTKAVMTEMFWMQLNGRKECMYKEQLSSQTLICQINVYQWLGMDTCNSQVM